MSSISSIISSSVVGTLLYALYVQYGPGLGGIWIRPDSLGNPVFVPHNLLTLMIEPFKNKAFWYPKNLDLNYMFILASSASLGYLHHQMSEAK